MSFMFDPLLFDPLVFDTGGAGVPMPAPYDWAPPLDLAGSAIIGQALRFMRLPPVARLSEQSEIITALAQAFDQAIDAHLAAADWSFASVLAILPQAAPTIVADDGLPVLCMLPGDLVHLREVRPQGARWRIDGQTLRCNAPAPVTIRYTGLITREDALPAAFKTAVALQIALLLGARWAGAAFYPEDIESLAIQTMKQAMREDARHAVSARAVPVSGLEVGGAGTGDWAWEATA